MAADTASASSAPERDGPQLVELLSPESGLTGEHELKVVRNVIIPYTYKNRQGMEIQQQKLQLLLQSRIPDQYCLGVAKQQKKDQSELQKLQQRFKVETVWKFTNVKLLDEKPVFIHTTCRITIDLRKSTAQAMLQSLTFPKAPVPTCTIADVLQLQQMQRFDLMALPAGIIDERRTGAGIPIADVRLADGSNDPHSNATEPASASLALTLFFKNDAEFNTFKENVGRSPMLFMCLSGGKKDGTVGVSTLKDQSWWQPAAGAKCDAMASQAAELCGAEARYADVASIPQFEHNEAADYVNVPATLTACRLMDTTALPEDLLGDATEHLYQLNHVYVQPPNKTDTIRTNDGNRLFAQFKCWDYSKPVTFAFRSKAMLQLAGLTEGQEKEYEDLIANDELRHPLLASLRLRVVKKTATAATEHSQTPQGNTLLAIVVEAGACTFTDIPNDSVEAIHGLLTGEPHSDRLRAVLLHNLKPSPFYNMLANGEPADKSLALLHFTQRTSGKQILNGFRLVSERVRDASDESSSAKYATISLCTVEKAPDFTAAKDTTALAIIVKVVGPSKSEHTADLFIEAMETVPPHQVQDAVAMMRKLQQVSTVPSGDANASVEAAWQQRKCRRLQRYPTQSA